MIVDGRLSRFNRYRVHYPVLSADEQAAIGLRLKRFLTDAAEFERRIREGIPDYAAVDIPDTGKIKIAVGKAYIRGIKTGLERANGNAAQARKELGALEGQLSAIQDAFAEGNHAAYFNRVDDYSRNSYGISQEDIEDCMNGAFAKAIDLFDFATGYRFTTYAYKVMRREWQRMRRDYSAERRMSRSISLNTGLAHREDEQVCQIMPRTDLTPEDTFMIDRERALLPGEIKDALSRISIRHAGIVRYRFGLNGGEPHTLEETGKQFGGITRERVRQILNEAKDKLRPVLEGRGVKYILKSLDKKPGNISRRQKEHKKKAKKEHSLSRISQRDCLSA